MVVSSRDRTYTKFERVELKLDEVLDDVGIVVTSSPVKGRSSVLREELSA